MTEYKIQDVDILLYLITLNFSSQNSEHSMLDKVGFCDDAKTEVATQLPHIDSYLQQICNIY